MMMVVVVVVMMMMSVPCMCCACVACIAAHIMNLPLKRFRQQAHAHEACPCPPETAWNAKHRLSHLIVERNPAEMLATRKHSEFPMFTLTTSNSVYSWLPLHGPVIPSNSPIANL